MLQYEPGRTFWPTHAKADPVMGWDSLFVRALRYGEFGWRWSAVGMMMVPEIERNKNTESGGGLFVEGVWC